jgi:hypothetical protein
MMWNDVFYFCLHINDCTQLQQADMVCWSVLQHYQRDQASSDSEGVNTTSVANEQAATVTVHAGAHEPSSEAMASVTIGQLHVVMMSQLEAVTQYKGF